MAISLEVPQIFRRHTNGTKVVTVNGGTIREILSRLGREYPELTKQLLEEDGRLHRFVNVYLNDEDIRFIQGLETPLKDGDRVSILPAVAGGRPAGGLPAVAGGIEPRHGAGVSDVRAAAGLPVVAGKGPGQGGTGLRP